jgi:serine/threonine protein kinase
VAIKRLLPKFTQEEVFKAFVKEIELLAKLNHPNILQVRPGPRCLFLLLTALSTRT